MSKEKKGNRSWKPASLLDLKNKDPNFRYRHVRKDDDNIARKLAEGWEFVDGLDKVEHTEPTGRPDLGKRLTSVIEGRDWITMKMPEETARARDEYINAKTAQSEQLLTVQTKRDLGSDVTVHGNVTIKKHGVATVIE